MLWTYTFTVWPCEGWGWSEALFDVFRAHEARQTVDMTEEDFERFRSTLGHDGFSLREVERVPYQEPETVL